MLLSFHTHNSLSLKSHLQKLVFQEIRPGKKIPSHNECSALDLAKCFGSVRLDGSSSITQDKQLLFCEYNGCTELDSWQKVESQA